MTQDFIKYPTNLVLQEQNLSLVCGQEFGFSQLKLRQSLEYLVMNSVNYLKHKEPFLITVLNNGLNNTCLKPNQIDTRGRISIYYGTTFGNSQRLAFQFANEASRHNFISQVINLSEFDEAQLRSSKLNVFFVSTYGQGEPTDDAIDFYNYWLISEECTDDFLRTTSFAVFAVGSTNYVHYCAMGIEVDRRLEQMGAKRLFPLGKGDAVNDCTNRDYEALIAQGLFKILEEAFPIVRMEKESVQATRYQIQESKKDESANATNLQFHANKYMNSQKLIICGVQEMRKNASLGNSTLLIDLWAKNFQYQAAQNLGVYPENSDENVSKLCDILSLDPKMVFEVVS